MTWPREKPTIIQCVVFKMEHFGFTNAVMRAKDGDGKWQTV